MEHYYIVADIGEGIPSYNFVLKAKNLRDACLEAEKILKEDYPDQARSKGSDTFNEYDYSCREITAEQLLKELTLN